MTLTDNSERIVLAISSQVTTGRVGLSAIGPAFEAAGVKGLFLPTILLSSRPGMGPLVKHIVPADYLSDALSCLKDDNRLAGIDGIQTGYFAEAIQVGAVARILATLKEERPDLPILVDPVIGDADRGLFVDPGVANAIRDELVPLATIIVPNRFELSWLAGTDLHTEQSMVDAARGLAPSVTVVTSAYERADRIGTLGISQTADLQQRGGAFCAGTKWNRRPVQRFADDRDRERSAGRRGAGAIRRGTGKGSAGKQGTRRARFQAAWRCFARQSWLGRRSGWLPDRLGGRFRGLNWQKCPAFSTLRYLRRNPGGRRGTRGRGGRHADRPTGADRAGRSRP